MKLDLNQSVKNIAGYDFVEDTNIAEPGQPENIIQRPQSLRSMLVAALLGSGKPEDSIEIRNKRARITWKIQKSKKFVALSVDDGKFVIDACRIFYLDFVYIPVLHILDPDQFEEPVEEAENPE